MNDEQKRILAVRTQSVLDSLEGLNYGTALIVLDNVNEKLYREMESHII